VISYLRLLLAIYAYPQELTEREYRTIEQSVRNNEENRRAARRVNMAELLNISF